MVDFLPLASSLERAACSPGAHAGRRADDRNSLLHLHYPAGLLVGGRVQPSRRQKNGTANSAVKEAANRATNARGAMTMISRLDEDKITHGEDWGTLGKKWRKFPIVRHCRLDLTRSVRGDACSNFLLPGRGESAERANAKKDRT